MKGNRIDLGLTGYNELFSSESSRNESKRPKIMDIPLSEIDDAPNHPFKVRIDEDMYKLVESIKENGVIEPAILRKKADGRYEIVAGHRRRKAYYNYFTSADWMRLFDNIVSSEYSTQIDGFYSLNEDVETLCSYYYKAVMPDKISELCSKKT